MRGWSSVLAPAIASAIGVSACGAGTEPPPPPPVDPVWSVEADELAGAALAIAKVGDALIAVGGPLAGDAPPQILRRDPGSKTWVPEAPPPGWRGAIWWAWSASPAEVWVVGEDLQVARGPLGSLVKVDVPPVQSSTMATLFGVWGSSAGDVWMVGGTPGDPTGPNGIVFRWDGSRLSRVALTGTATAALGEALFKVWGSSAQDVLMIGTGGVCLRWNGDELARVATPARERLLTVHGRGSNEAYAVGGFQQGVVLAFDGARWSEIGDPDMPPLNGVFAAPDGALWVGGIGGYLARRERGVWTSISTRLFGRDFHAVYAGAEGVFASGGQLVVSPNPRRGIIGRFGPP